MTKFTNGQKVRDFYGVYSFVIEQRETTVLTTNGIYHITKVI
jgi:hypothetical protein